MALYGAELNEPGLGLARLYGATVLTLAVTYWLGRSAAPSEARRALVTGGFVGNLLAVLAGIVNALSGAFNSLLWASIVLWPLFALGFAYFLFRRPEAA
jgi:hypothetical protein